MNFTNLILLDYDHNYNELNSDWFEVDGIIEVPQDDIWHFINKLIGLKKIILVVIS